MKKLFLILALVAFSLLSMAQTNQLVWYNGRLMYGASVDKIDSLTFTEVTEVDTLDILLPRTVFLIDTVFVYDTIYISNCDSVPTEKPDDNGTENGYEYVDLGLSVNWATYNVGATTPEGYGNFYAWGETQPKEVYDVTTYKYCEGTNKSYFKYCTDTNFGLAGFVDGKLILEAMDDAASVNWGGTWRMPTFEEQRELIENCYMAWTEINGVKGCLFRSKIEGYEDKTIFIPAAGYMYVGTHTTMETNMYCWSSSLDVRDTVNYAIYDTDNSSFALYMGFASNGLKWAQTGRYFGYPVRAVCPNDRTKEEPTTPEPERPVVEYEYVDLALPSGTLWATCNVGATTPEGYGNFYAWGEIEPKEDYSWETYKYCEGSNYKEITKYCTDSTFGKDGLVDNKVVLELDDDAAAASSNNLWRIPTHAEWDELMENCTWEGTTQNGVVGIKITATNGNSIFLPAAGQITQTTHLNKDITCFYWSSRQCFLSETPNYRMKPYNAYCIAADVSSGTKVWRGDYRSGGLTIRPVRNK